MINQLVTAAFLMAGFVTESYWRDYPHAIFFVLVAIFLQVAKEE